MAGLMSPVAAAPPQGKPPPTPTTTAARRSPGNGNGTRRGQKASSPPPLPTGASPQQQPGQPPPSQPPPLSNAPLSTNSTSAPANQHLPQHSLPPPPISFAKRRAAVLGGKKKPADILISPLGREGGLGPVGSQRDGGREYIQPLIHSAPPSQLAFNRASIGVGAAGQPGSFTMMALPRLPSVIGQADLNVRRVASNVPPTPTRLSMAQAMGSSSNGGTPPTPINVPSIAATTTTTTNRSPPAPSVPIASSLHAPSSSQNHLSVPSISSIPHTPTFPTIPPTPTTLLRPSYTSQDKAAFLAPFDMFYDALNDSRQLKKWLGEQLGRSQGLIRSVEALKGDIERDRERWASGSGITTMGTTTGGSVTAVGSKEQETMIEAILERKMGAVKAEVGALRRRVEELEEVVRGYEGGSASASGSGPGMSAAASSSSAARQGSLSNVDMAPHGLGGANTKHSTGNGNGAHHHQSQQHARGQQHGLGASEAYTFPPVSVGPHERHQSQSHSQQQLQQQRSHPYTQHYDRDRDRGDPPAPRFAFSPPQNSSLRVDRPELGRRLSSPGWGHSGVHGLRAEGPVYRDRESSVRDSRGGDRDTRERDTRKEREDLIRSENGSPAPGFDARRMPVSVSASRHESGMHSPSQMFRERDRERDRKDDGGGTSSRPTPNISRQNSNSNMNPTPGPIPMVIEPTRSPSPPATGEVDRGGVGGERETASTGNNKRRKAPSSRRSSISMDGVEEDDG